MKVVLTALALAFVAGPALAASKPAPPPELQSVRKALAAAVKARDMKAAAALARFPLDNSAYQAPDKISKTEFLSSGYDLFGSGDKKLLKCLATGAFEHQSGQLDFPGSPWLIDCDGNEFFFGLVNGKWRLTSLMNVNE